MDRTTARDHLRDLGPQPRRPTRLSPTLTCAIAMAHSSVNGFRVTACRAPCGGRCSPMAAWPRVRLTWRGLPTLYWAAGWSSPAAVRQMAHIGRGDYGFGLRALRVRRSLLARAPRLLRRLRDRRLDRPDAPAHDRRRNQPRTHRRPGRSLRPSGRPSPTPMTTAAPKPADSAICQVCQTGTIAIAATSARPGVVTPDVGSNGRCLCAWRMMSRKQEDSADASKVKRTA